MKILITGGTGFQGSNLSKKLLESGYDVNILNLYSNKSMLNIERFNLKDASITWGTILDIHTVKDVARDVDLIIHAAAKIHVDDSIEYPQDYFMTNVIGTCNVLEVARQFNIPVMHISTCEVYGHQKADLHENCPLMPRSPYASSKAGADRMAYSYYTTYGLNVCIVRPFNVFGRGQKDGKTGAVIPIWTSKLLSGKDIAIYGEGEQSREFIYIDDLISAYEILIPKMISGKSLAGETINVGTGTEVKVKDLAFQLRNTVNTLHWKEPKNHDFSYPPAYEYDSKYSKIIFDDARPGEVKRFISNSDKMKSFDWSLKIDLKSGLNDYVSWRIELGDLEYKKQLMMGM